MTSDSVMRALAGGVLIGLATAIALFGSGRIAGISGTLGNAFDADDDSGRSFRLAFLFGLIGTGVIATQLFPSMFGTTVATTPVAIVAGLLVGIGTTLGSGCTSGHGVCGISRGSKRSLVAVPIFMAVAMITATIRGAL